MYAIVQFSSKKTLFTDAWIIKTQLIFAGMGIARLMVIDLEPLHLLEVLEAAPTQEPGTQRGIVLWYLFSSMRAELAGPPAVAGDPG